jgi:hypothetical protein
MARSVITGETEDDMISATWKISIEPIETTTNHCIYSSPLQIVKHKPIQMHP